jgi:hypothetical protein
LTEAIAGGAFLAASAPKESTSIIEEAVEDLKPVAWFVYESLDGSGVKTYTPIFK